MQARNIMEAGELVASLHGKCLRAAIDKLGKHKEGLSAAARDLFRAQLIDSSRKRKLLQIDSAFHLTRHISSESVHCFVAQFMDEIDKQPVYNDDESAHSTTCEESLHSPETLDVEPPSSNPCIFTQAMVGSAAPSAFQESTDVATLDQWLYHIPDKKTNVANFMH